MIGRRPELLDHRLVDELRRLQSEVVDDARRLVEADPDHPWWEHLGLDPAAEAAVVLGALVAATHEALASTGEVAAGPAGPDLPTPAELLAAYESLTAAGVPGADALPALVSATAVASGRLDQLLEL